MSNIVTTSINPDYPIAGQDNDTQGFRTNFSAIKTALETAKTELEILETAGSTDLIRTPAAVPGTPSVIDFSLGQFQRFIMGADATFTFAGWPVVASRAAKVTVEFSVSVNPDNAPSLANPHYVRFTNVITTDSSTTSYPVLFNEGFTDTSEDQSTLLNGIKLTNVSDRILVEFITPDAGITIYSRYLGKFTTRTLL